ncbi:MAG: hypothetical protein QGD93_11570 [Actinomycetota bacterium]|nr:hypothetical protein [Actinomycetota bacterium]
MTTPRGVFIFPHLTVPDTKFVKPDGEYHTKFALDADLESTSSFVDQLAALLDEFIAEYRRNKDNKMTAAKYKKTSLADIFEDEVDEEGEDTGRLVFKFKLKAKVETAKKSWNQKPRLFDSSAAPIVGEVNIWTGSEGKVNVEVFPYFMQSSKTFGLSLRIKGAQILKLVSGQGVSAEDMGFGTEDDGYVAEPDAAGFEDESDGGEGGTDGQQAEF